MSTPHKPLTNILGWTLIIAISIVLIVIIVEVALRVLLPEINILTRVIEPTADSRNYILRANTEINYQGLYEKREPITWHINQQGLRSDRVENYDSNNFRILTYGDSETFGWSIAIDDSWQRKMENIDENVEVLNFGIPGYNVVNIADHMHITASDYNPDMLIYFFNKNDFYPAFDFNPTLSKSYAYLALRMIIYRLSKDERKAWRNSVEGAEFMQTHIKRMIDISREYNAPLYILVMHWKYSHAITGIPKLSKDGVVILNIEDTLDKFPKADAHLTSPAHLALAELLCAHISNGIAKSCTPPNIADHQ